MSPTSYADLFELLAASEVDPGDLVAHELSLNDVSDRLAAMENYEMTGVEAVTGL
jgi:alcohol dehydrogenase